MRDQVSPVEELKQYLHAEMARYDAELAPKIERLRAKAKGYADEGRRDRANDMEAEIVILMEEREMALRPIKQHLLQIAVQEDALRPPKPILIPASAFKG